MIVNIEKLSRSSDIFFTLDGHDHRCDFIDFENNTTKKKKNVGNNYGVQLASQVSIQRIYMPHMKCFSWYRSSVCELNKERKKRGKLVEYPRSRNGFNVSWFLWYIQPDFGAARPWPVYILVNKERTFLSLWPNTGTGKKTGSSFCFFLSLEPPAEIFKRNLPAAGGYNIYIFKKKLETFRYCISFRSGAYLIHGLRVGCEPFSFFLLLWWVFSDCYFCVRVYLFWLFCFVFAFNLSLFFLFIFFFNVRIYFLLGEMRKKMATPIILTYIFLLKIASRCNAIRVTTGIIIKRKWPLLFSHFLLKFLFLFCFRNYFLGMN